MIGLIAIGCAFMAGYHYSYQAVINGCERQGSFYFQDKDFICIPKAKK